MSNASCIPPAPARGEIRTFPAGRIVRDAPSSERIALFHRGVTLTFASPRALFDELAAAHPDFLAFARLEARAAEDLKGRAALAAQRHANGVRLARLKRAARRWAARRAAEAFTWGVLAGGGCAALVGLLSGL